MARVIARGPRGPGRGAMLGEAIGGGMTAGMEQAMQRQREEDERRRAFEQANQRLNPMYEALQGSMGGAPPGTPGQAMLQAALSSPESFTQMMMQPGAIQGMGQMAQMAMEPPPADPYGHLSGTARELAQLIDMAEEAAVQGSPRRVEHFLSAAADAAGMAPAEWERKKEALRDLGLTGDELVRAQRQILGAPAADDRLQLVEGTDAQGNPTFAVANLSQRSIESLGGEVVPVVEVTEDLHRMFAEQAVQDPTGGRGMVNIPDNIDLNAALGSGGFLRNAINTAVGLFDSDRVPAAQTQRAAETLNTLATMVMLTLQANVPGRPSNYLMEELNRLVVRPGQMTLGRARAQERIETLLGYMDNETARLSAVMQQPEGALSRSDIQAAALNREQLMMLSNSYRQVLEQLREPPGTRTAPAPGITIEWID